MKADFLDSDTLRIQLSAEELAQNRLTFHTLNDHDPHARAFLLALTRAAGLLFGRDIAIQSVHIEAYPYADGGCLLFLTPQQAAVQSYAFFAESLPALVQLCTALMPYDTALEQSAAFRLTAGYALLLTFQTAPPQTLLSACTPLFDVGIEPRSIFSEYAEVVCESDAVRVFSALDQAR